MELLVPLDSHAPSHILLGDGDEGIKFFRPERLERSKHTRTEKDLGKTTLVFVRVVDCPLQDQRAKRFKL